MLRPGQITGSDRRQTTLATPLVAHVIADGRLFPHAVLEVLQPGFVSGLTLITEWLSRIGGLSLPLPIGMPTVVSPGRCCRERMCLAVASPG